MSLLLALLISAGPGEPLRVASLGFTPAGGMPKDLAAFYSEHFAQKLNEQPGLNVVSAKAIAAVLGLERQRQLMGCAGASSGCLAELAGAMGTQMTVLGEAVSLERSTQIDVRVIDSSTGKVLYTGTRREKTREKLLDALDELAADAGQKLTALKIARAEPAPAPAPEPVVQPSPAAISITPATPVRWQPWALTGGGALAVIGGGVCLGLSASAWSTLNAPPKQTLTPADARGLANGAQTQQLAGYLLLAVGVAALAGGLLWQWAGD